MTEVDPSEFQIARIVIGALGKNDNGIVVEGVVVEFSLPTGLRANIDWPMDAGDRDVMQKLSDYVEQKIKDMIAGRQGFTPTAEQLELQVD